MITILLLMFFTLTIPVQYVSDELILREITDKSFTRIDYMRNGKITVAADKGYATVIKTDSYEEYFDEKEREVVLPAGYSKISKKDGTISYLDKEGNPVLINDGFDSIHRTYTEDRQCYIDTYYIGNEQVEHRSGYWQCKHILENGKEIEVQYLDNNSNLIIQEKGYSVIKRIYSDNIRIDLFYGVDGKPVSLSLGQYGVQRIYDNQGREVITTYLGVDERPINTIEGYAIIKTTYDEKGKIQLYYDANEQPVTAGAYQYGSRIENGQRVYLDKNGRKMFRIDNYLNNHIQIVATLGILLSILVINLKGRLKYIFILLYGMFILVMTFVYREPGASRSMLDLFWSYKQFFSSTALRRNILNNIWLFVPLGCALSSIKHGWVQAILFSIVIEVYQYFTGMGIAECDDVVSNTLGVIVGFSIHSIYDDLKIRFKKRIYTLMCQEIFNIR